MFISVIIPVFNGKRFLNRCFESLESQTIFKDLEIIIIDDGSTDGSDKLIDKFALIHSNVKVFHIPNGGVSNARNIGLLNATGEFLTFYDVDDWIEPYYYEKMVKEITPDIDVVCSGFIAEYEGKSVLHKSKEDLELNNLKAIEYFLKAEQLDRNIWNKLFRRKNVENIRFDCNLIWGEDGIFTLNCLKEATKVRVISNAWYHYVINPDSAMRTTMKQEIIDSCLNVMESIKVIIQTSYPEYVGMAESSLIDSKCRLLAEIYRSKKKAEYLSIYKKLQKDIREYSLLKKMHYSGKKHTLALLAAKISPSIYVVLKYKMKLQYQ